MSFETSKEIKEQIKNAIYQAMGQASMCWENPEKAGIFDSTQAIKVGDELWEIIDSQMEVNSKL